MSRKFKNAYGQVRTYARKCLQWLERVNEKDILDELDVGMGETTAAETGVEHCRLEQTKDAKNGGVKHVGMDGNMEELHRDLWSMLLHKCEGEAWLQVNIGRDGEGLWVYTEMHRRFTKTTLQGQTKSRMRIMQPLAHENDGDVPGAEDTIGRVRQRRVTRQKQNVSIEANLGGRLQ